MKLSAIIFSALFFLSSCDGENGFSVFSTKTLPNFITHKGIPERKNAFILYMTPRIIAANNKILKERNHLIFLYDRYLENRLLSEGDKAWLEKLASEYFVKNFNYKNTEEWKKLLSRVDIIPISVALAQAANESAWGTSRFASEGNNLFGQWCFSDGCGIVPARREEGYVYEVAKFADVDVAIEKYMRNLNTHNAYAELRNKRLNRCDATAYANLIDGLLNYSEMGWQYIKTIRTMIRQNNLVKFDRQYYSCRKVSVI